MASENCGLTFISYAQCFEDAVLYRALKDVEKGCYIDVGANDPTTSSVTKAFYERAWRGINVEPVRYWFERLLKERPGDINLNVAAGATEGALKLFEVVGSGLSTADATFARRHQESGWTLAEYEVPMVSLNKICMEHKIQQIHFLKIDVEGFEKQVLEGLDLTRFRPWIILAEATEPMTDVENWQDWEYLLLENDYSFSNFDGLNRFYFANEHSQLAAILSEPIEEFDCRRFEEMAQ